ncbi:MAG: MATE family efflux transporter, partial [Proteobacteria bacterium]|nr:MATE family efflux transporter [Pseudomonadota bacterium]
KIFVMGGPVALAMLVMPISAAGLNYVLAPFGPAYMGAWTLSARMEQMIILPLIGLSCSLIPFAGFNLGAGNGVRIREAVRILILVCYGILVPVSVILWICAPGVIGLFRPDSQVLSLSVHAFRLALLGYWLGPMELIVTGLAQGVKRPRYTLFINVSRLLVLRLPLAFLFASLWGGRGVYISHTVSLLVSGLVCLFILRHLLLLVDRDCTRKQ